VDSVLKVSFFEYLWVTCYSDKFLFFFLVFLCLASKWWATAYKWAMAISFQILIPSTLTGVRGGAVG